MKLRKRKKMRMRRGCGGVGCDNARGRSHVWLKKRFR